MDASKIVFLTKDLMIQSNASSAARQADVSIQAIPNLDEAIALVIGNTVGLLLVDLQMPGLDVAELIEKFSSLESPCRLIAFAQHVEEDLIARARDGGFEAVLTRGQFSRNLPTIVKEFAAQQIPKS